MKRLFLGVNLPDALRGELAAYAAWMGEFKRTVKVVPPVNYHLTLKFLGNTGPELEEMIREALSTKLTLRPVEGRLEARGTFPDKTKPEVFWIGAGPSNDLEKLFLRCEDLMGELDFPKETRAFHPHVTLARAHEFKKTPPEFLALWKETKVPSSKFPAFPIDAVTLFESVLNGHEAVYREVAVFK